MLKWLSFPYNCEAHISVYAFLCHAEYWTAWALESSFQIQFARIFVSFDTAEM